MTTTEIRTEKRCPKCGETKNRSEFNRSTIRPDGLQGYCRLCQKARNNELNPLRPAGWNLAYSHQDGGAYASWRNLKNRVNNPNHNSYSRYGGRGIRYHPDFETYPGFLAYMGPRPEGTSIDRIDPDGHYEPGNVRWLDEDENRFYSRPAGSLDDAVVQPPTWEI
jgi:hypothetical protein